jgi:hypothetical protein
MDERSRFGKCEFAGSRHRPDAPRPLTAGRPQSAGRDRLARTGLYRKDEEQPRVLVVGELTDFGDNVVRGR